MKIIGVISDTHSYFDERLYDFFAEVDEIWHAGDIGSEEVLETIEKFKQVRAVYGNCDNIQLRMKLKEVERFECEGVDVLLTHIGGYPGAYSTFVKQLIQEKPPKLFICGHSHILKIMPDEKYNLLHINPGAAGNYGPHNVQTAVRFELVNGEIKNVVVIELKM
jgi:putative phosphoesterase